MAVKFVERPGTNVQNLQLTREEWKVISYVHPRNSIRQIGRVTKMNDVEIRRIVYSLLEAGIVELIRPQDTRNQTPQSIPTTASMTTKEKEERKSLLSRIIDKIRSL
jgi:hypothetical protein